MNPEDEPDALRHREVLNRALRELATGTGAITDRMGVAGSVLLAGIRARELGDAEERRVFERIEIGLMELAVVGERSSLRVFESVDDAARGLAHDVLDLHQMVEARAIEETADYWRGGGREL
jgi:hypothetical protein